MIQFRVTDIMNCAEKAERAYDSLKKQGKQACLEHSEIKSKIDNELAAVQQDISIANEDLSVAQRVLSSNTETLGRVQQELSAARQHLSALNEKKAGLVNSEPVYKTVTSKDENGNTVTEKVQTGWKTPEREMRQCEAEIECENREISALTSKIEKIHSANNQLQQMIAEINNVITQKHSEYNTLISLKDSVSSAYERFCYSNKKSQGILSDITTEIHDTSEIAFKTVNILLEALDIGYSSYSKSEDICLPQDGRELSTMEMKIRTELTDISNQCRNILDDTNRYRDSIVDNVSSDVEQLLSKILDDVKDTMDCLENRCRLFDDASRCLWDYMHHKQ